MDFTETANNLVRSISEQVAMLNWVLIIATVGFAEMFKKNIKGTKKTIWTFPVICGFVVGVTEYLMHAKLSNLVQYVAGIVQSAFIYSGWSGFVYLFIRPIKYWGDKMKGTGNA